MATTNWRTPSLVGMMPFTEGSWPRNKTSVRRIEIILQRFKVMIF